MILTGCLHVYPTIQTIQRVETALYSPIHGEVHYRDKHVPNDVPVQIKISRVVRWGGEVWTVD